MNTHKKEWIAVIAKDILGFETLETRNRDCLDFRDCGVASVKSALEQAYEAGRRYGCIQAQELLQNK